MSTDKQNRSHDCTDDREHTHHNGACHTTLAIQFYCANYTDTIHYAEKQ